MPRIIYGNLKRVLHVDLFFDMMIGEEGIA